MIRMDFLRTLDSEHISLIINGFFTLFGVLLGVFITHILQNLGSIKVIIKNVDIKYDSDSSIPSGWNKLDVTFDKSQSINIELKIDFFNSSISSKSIRELKIVNEKRKTLDLKDKSTARNLSVGFIIDVIEIANFMPNEMKELHVVANTDKSFFNNSETERIYLQYKIGNNKMSKKVLIRRD